MKKAFYIFALFVLFFGAVPDAGAASLLLHGSPRVGARTAIAYQGVEDIYFRCNSASAGCPDTALHPSPYTISYEDWNWHTIIHVVCQTGQPNCWTAGNLYYHWSFTFTWTGKGHLPPHDAVSLETNIGTEVTYPCGSGYGGSCSGVRTGIVAVGGTGETGYVDAMLAPVVINERIATRSLQATLTLSFEPINTCEDEYVSLTTDTYIIDPTIELPLGPAGEPPDDQIYPTVTGETYALKLDGEWNDGAADRDDAAVSWDGETWTPLVDIPGCASQGEDGEIQIYYITALTETFYIRANDQPAAFANNIQGDPEFSYTIDLTVPIGEGCDTQYEYDEFEDVVGFVGVPSTSEIGVLANNAEQSLVIGEWYVLRWDYGTWTDGADPTERIDLEYMMDANWADLTTGSNAVWCVNIGDNEILFQASAENILLRVNNTFGTFGDNAGTPYYTLYHVTFTRTPEACETQIRIDELIEHKTVEGDQGGGMAFASSVTLTAGEWYVLDTVDGPWWNLVFSTDPYYQYNMDVEEGTTGGIGTWGPLEDWARPTCNVKTDTLGHRRVIFQMPEGDDLEWRLRVGDVGSFLSNAGSMSWDLYGATQYSTDPGEGETCDYSYDVGEVIDLGEVMGNDALGVPLDGLVTGEIYAIKLIGNGYGWKEQTFGTTLYDMQISDNSGVNYYPIDGYGGVLCQEANGNDLTIFVSPGQNYNYKLRVDSNSFDDNTGKMAFAVYPAEVGQSVVNTCLEGLSKQILDEFTWIDVRREEGQLLTTDNARYEEYLGLVPGRMYYVETPADQGPWKTAVFGGEEKWTTALSKDNAETWNELGFDNPDIDCASYNAFGHVWGAKFTVQEGDLWKIRVNDLAGEFANNSGNMAFKFYVLCEGMSCTGSLPGEPNPEEPIQGGGNVCKMAIIRPGPLSFEALTNLGTYVGSWLQYVNLSILRYMAWCPKHTNSFMTFLRRFETREPWATIDEWETQLKQAEQQINSYDWGDNSHQNTSIFEIGSQSEMREWIYDHFFKEQDAIWNGADLVSFGDGTLPDAYYSCGNAFTAILPPRLKQPICFVTAWFIESNAAFWIQIVLDISAIFLLYEMVKGALQDAIYMMTGVKPWVKSSNRQNWVTIEKGLGSDAPAPSAVRDQVADELSDMLGGRFGRNNDGTWSRK